MIPKAKGKTVDVKSVPRVGGGDPGLQFYAITGGRCSPRRRG